MSEENEQAVRAIYERFAQGDFRASADLLDPHIVFMLFANSPDAPVYVEGRSGRGGSAHAKEDSELDRGRECQGGPAALPPPPRFSSRRRSRPPGPRCC